MNSDELYELSDEELEKLFKEAKADMDSADVDYGNEGGTDELEEFEDDEEEVDYLEQSDEDSDDDASSDEDEEEDSEEESETTEDNPDVDTDVDEDEPVDEDDKSDEDEQPIQKRKYRANGQEYEFSDQEIFSKFGDVFGQAMNYTQKMQQIKPWRKTIDAIEQAGLTGSDLNLAIDVLKGDKDAIATVLKRTGTDALDLDVENTEYAPKDYGRNDTELDIKDIVSEISSDREYAVTYDVLERQWDEGSRKAFVDNPALIRELHTDVKSGMFDIIAPRANKLKVYDGGKGSSLDYYMMAAKEYFSEQAQNEVRLEAQRSAKVLRETKEVDRQRIADVKSKSVQREVTKNASNKRKAAAPSKKSSKAKVSIDMLDGSDESFDKWYNELQDKM